MFYRGSTVTLVFNVKNKNLDLSQIDICHFTIANDSRRNQRTIENCILDNENKKIKVPLSQNDTLSFEPGYLLMQFKIGSINNNDYSIALSNIMRSYIEQDMEGIAWTINPNSEDPTDGNIVNLIETIGDIQFSESEFTLDLEFEGIVMDTVVIPNPPGEPEEQLNTVLIKNKVYDIGVNPDWDEDDITSKAFIQNKPIIPAAQVQVDWDQADSSKIDFIKNKPSIPDPQIQSNWSESDNSKVDFIKNKPTKLSDFNNDQGFIDNTVNNLTNYYKKSEIYTQQEVNTLISAITTISIEVVQELPTTDIQTNVIYLVPKSPSQTDNYYDEYINTNGTSSGWEKIGDTEIDLSNYYTKTQTDSLLANKVDKIEGKGLSTNDYDDTAKGIVNGVTSALANKVDKVEGKELSENDYTDEDKALVGTITDKLDRNENAIRSNALAFISPTNDTAPYIYRQTPVKESFKALMKKIVGASVVWNQILQNGNFASTDNWTTTRGTLSVANNVGTYTISYIGASATQNRLRQAITGLANHKYIISCEVNSPHNSTFTFMQVQGTTAIDSKAISITSGKRTVKTILAPSSAFNEQWFCIDCRSGFEVDEEILFKNVYLIDLTAMFGTTIADYVYTLETAEAGSGIAWLQSYGFFTEDYYAYKQNKLESGCVSAKKIVGFNQFDGETELGVYNDTTGQKQSSTNQLRSKNKIKILPNTTYCFYNTVERVSKIFYYDENENFIRANSNSSAQIYTNTSPSNARYVAFQLPTAYGTTYLNSVCVNISDSAKNGTYTPYVEPTTYPLSPITLRGLFKLSTDKLTVDGDEYNADGSVTRKYGIVEITNNTSLTGFQTSADYGAYANISGISAKVQGTDVVRLIADKCEVVSFNNRIVSPTIDRAYIDNNGNLVIHANNSSSISSADALKSEFLGTTIIYEVATPTTEQTTPFTETEIVGSTEEFIDYEVAQGNRDVAIPVGTDTDYYQEMKLPSLPTTSGNHSLQYNPASGFSWS